MVPSICEGIGGSKVVIHRMLKGRHFLTLLQANAQVLIRIEIRVAKAGSLGSQISIVIIRVSVSSTGALSSIVRLMTTTTSRTAAPALHPNTCEWWWHVERTSGCDKRCRIDRRHPDSGLVDLKEVRHQRIEIDIRIGKIVEGEFLPVPLAKMLA